MKWRCESTIAGWSWTQGYLSFALKSRWGFDKQKWREQVRHFANRCRGETGLGGRGVLSCRQRLQIPLPAGSRQVFAFSEDQFSLSKEVSGTDFYVIFSVCVVFFFVRGQGVFCQLLIHIQLDGVWGVGGTTWERFSSSSSGCWLLTQPTQQRALLPSYPLSPTNHLLL